MTCLEYQFDMVAMVAADLGEGPIWDERTDTLLFVDSTAGRLYRFQPGSGALSHVDVGQELGVVIPRRGGGLVASGRDGLLAVGESGAATLLVPIEQGRATRLNDARCDARGRLWTGSIPLDGARRACALYRIDTDLSVALVEQGISVSNGIAWSPDDTTMYYVDTRARGIDRFDYDLATGATTNRRRFADIDRADGVPDGITVDAAGHVWVALYLGGAVRRYSPDGVRVGEIALPVSGITSCGFGGPAMSDLYITTARHGVAPARLASEPLAGALFRCRPGVAGLATYRFGG